MNAIAEPTSEQNDAVSASSQTTPEAPLVLHTRVVSGHGGGPEKTILNSPRFLRDLGYASQCAYMRPPGDEGFERIRLLAAELDAPLIAIDDRGPLDWKIFRRMLGVCREHDVAIWHGHDYKSNALGLALRRFHPMRLVTTVHGWVKFTRRTPLYYAVDRFCLRYYDRVICVSEDLERRCLAAGVKPERCVLLKNAIDTEQFRRRRDAAAAKRRLGVAPERTLIGAVGRISQEKGFDLLIRAVDRLIEAGHDVELAILGEGDARRRLEAQIRELGLSDRVRLPGFQTHAIDWFEAMDIFALSSIREGLPNVLLEAMSLEVPVVATRVAGVPGLIENGREGLLVEPGDVDALEAALERFLVDRNLRRRLAVSARAAIERDYSFLRRMETMRTIYDDLLGRGETKTTT